MLCALSPLCVCLSFYCKVCDFCETRYCIRTVTRDTLNHAVHAGAKWPGATVCKPHSLLPQVARGRPTADRAARRTNRTPHNRPTGPTPHNRLCMATQRPPPCAAKKKKGSRLLHAAGPDELAPAARGSCTGRPHGSPHTDTAPLTHHLARIATGSCPSVRTCSAAGAASACAQDGAARGRGAGRAAA